MRQYTINNEFIYNESLREIISLHDKKVLKVTLMGNDSNLLIVFYVQIMPDDLVMQLHRF
ncbi:hypothetical protein GRF87_002157 [Salmonella enterica]|nr:hypothetical protein [Salmonella enterica]